MEDKLKQLEKEIDKLKEDIKILTERRISQTMVLPYAIKRGHLEDKVIVFGLAADRPTDDTSGISVWFATDTDVLSLYNGDDWVSETLT